MSVKLGFIGTGGIAHAHLNNLAKMDGVTVSAFYDVAKDRAESAAAAWTDARAYDKVTDMLDDRKLDGVYICVPPMAHGEAESLVVERGLPFLVEKPLGIDNEVPRSIAAAVSAKKLITSVGYHWRYSSTVQQARELLKERTFGMALGYWMGGMPMVPWWRKQDGSGGQFVEQTTHIADLLRYLCGEVTEVYAAEGRRVMPSKVEGTTVADVATVTMKLASGGVATISNTCLLPIGHHVGLDLYTDAGVLEIRGDSLKDIVPGDTREVRNDNNPYAVEDEAFVHALRTGDASRILSDYADSLKTHELTIAANVSAVTGQPVRLG